MTKKLAHNGNPQYPKLSIPAAVKAGPRRAYGYAVLEAFKRLQAAELERFCKRGVTAPLKCASGTDLTDGHAILAAIREQHRRLHT